MESEPRAPIAMESCSFLAKCRWCAGRRSADGPHKTVTCDPVVEKVHEFLLESHFVARLAWRASVLTLHSYLRA